MFYLFEKLINNWLLAKCTVSFDNFNQGDFGYLRVNILE
jgi:hypothetical protein